MEEEVGSQGLGKGEGGRGKREGIPVSNFTKRNQMKKHLPFLNGLLNILR